MSKVELIVDGKRHGKPINMINGDSLLFTMTGQGTGEVRPEIEVLRDQVRNLSAQSHKLRQIAREAVTIYRDEWIETGNLRFHLAMKALSDETG